MPAAASRPRIAADQRSRAIVAATLQLFARQGFAATTTRQIARAAGVSEALVFKHFPTKQSLYRAILESKIRDAQAALPFDASLEALDDEDFLVRVASRILERVAEDDSFLRLLLRSGLEGHPLAREFHHARVDVVCAEIERRLRRRRLRRRDRRRGGVDPKAAARIFHGMILSSLLARQVFREPTVGEVPAQAWARTLVRVFLHGIDAGGARP